MTTDPIHTSTMETIAGLSGKATGLPAETLEAMVVNKLVDAETPGYWAEFTREEAEMAGFFRESALSEEAAYDASFDNPNVFIETDER